MSHRSNPLPSFVAVAMFEAKLSQLGVLKRILDAMKDLVTSANFDCLGSGIEVNAMDSSHIALVSLSLHHGAFIQFRCDVNRSLGKTEPFQHLRISSGISITNLSKFLKCCDSNESVYIRAEDRQDKVLFSIENPGGSRIEIVLNMS